MRPIPLSLVFLLNRRGGLILSYNMQQKYIKIVLKHKLKRHRHSSQTPLYWAQGKLHNYQALHMCHICAGNKVKPLVESLLSLPDNQPHQLYSGSPIYYRPRAAHGIPACGYYLSYRQPRPICAQGLPPRTAALPNMARISGVVGILMPDPSTAWTGNP